MSVSDGFALDGPAADVVLAVMAWAARMERLAINERIAAARERVEAEGRSWGWPRRLSTRDCERLRALRDQGRSVRDIAVAMKVPRSTVARALARVVKPGRTLTVSMAEVFALEAGREKLVLLMTATNMTLRDRTGLAD